MFSPQWLRTFETLAAQRSFTRAAERLDLTQAAVSQHVQRLEERLGPLLIRRPRKLELTPRAVRCSTTVRRSGPPTSACSNACRKTGPRSARSA